MTTTRRFDLIVFDWDGTLFDSTALIVRCIQQACATSAPQCRATRCGLRHRSKRDALRHAVLAWTPRYPELDCAIGSPASPA
jgi:phosphoglycolate phosphatase